MIIVEGCALTGRSNFAEMLSRYLGYTLLHKPDNVKHPYFDYLPHIKPKVVYDMFHMLDLLSGDTTWNYYTSLDRMLLKRAVVIVVLTADDDVIKERYGRHYRRSELSIENQLEVNAFYRKCATGNYLNVSPYVHLRHNATDEDEYPGIDEAKQIECISRLLADIAAFLKSTEEVR